MLKITIILSTVFWINYAKVYDQYHFLHLEHDPPIYPTLSQIPKTNFQCNEKDHGYYADVEAQCQVYHLCQRDTQKISFLCTNGTLFNEQFQVCDQFYNVRCGSSFIDL